MGFWNGAGTEELSTGYCTRHTRPKLMRTLEVVEFSCEKWSPSGHGKHSAREPPNKMTRVSPPEGKRDHRGGEGK